MNSVAGSVGCTLRRHERLTGARMRLPQEWPKAKSAANEVSKQGGTTVHDRPWILRNSGIFLWLCCAERGCRISYKPHRSQIREEGNTMFKNLSEQPIAELQNQQADKWVGDKLLEKCVTTREGMPSFVFFEGPPTANGKPGIHHVNIRRQQCRP